MIFTETALSAPSFHEVRKLLETPDVEDIASGKELQGRGIGSFAVRALASEAKTRGFAQITALWEPGEDGPDHFFRALGFTVLRETQYGENFGVLTL